MELVLDGSICIIKFRSRVPSSHRYRWCTWLSLYAPDTWGELNVRWKVNKTTPGRLSGMSSKAIHVVDSEGRTHTTNWQNVYRVDLRAVPWQARDPLVVPLDRT